MTVESAEILAMAFCPMTIDKGVNGANVVRIIAYWHRLAGDPRPSK
jgi:hypothetical protein